MRLLYIDVDTLRADHLGCYGYPRDTSPNIDALAVEATRFDRCYVSDAPCLPSRTALLTGQFGIHNGVIGHAGSAADLIPEGPTRGFRTTVAETSWPALLRRAGLHTATISTFGERHSAFHWYAGFNEVFNLGTRGLETADAVSGAALRWLEANGRRESWFLHVHLWDPHTPYRTPASFGDPFEDVAAPDWLTEEVRARHWELPGPRSAREVMGFTVSPDAVERWPRQPQTLDSPRAVKRMFDGYDTGIRFADAEIGRILNALSDLGVSDDTAVLVSADHGETLGELFMYCDHLVADESTSRVPLLLRWPGIASASGRVDRAWHYQVDVAATIVELVGEDVPPTWDGAAFAPSFRLGTDEGRDHLVLSQAAWTAQRSVRFDDYLFIKTYDDGYQGYPEQMLFDIARDPHEQNDIAAEKPQVVRRGLDLLEQWRADALAVGRVSVDPMETMLAEGGPQRFSSGGRFMTQDEYLRAYLSHLEATGREKWAERIGSARAAGRRTL